MRLLSTSLLLSIMAFVGACSKGNYAQVEPDDLYFTHKDRKASQNYYGSSASVATSAAVTDDASYNYSDADVSAYTNQHSPVLPTYTLGSPTIQQYEEPFYGASQNPDYLVAQDLEYEDGGNDAYYMEDYASYDAVVTDDIPYTTVNNYYGYNPYSYGAPSGNYYYSSMYPRKIYYNPFTFSISYGYSPFSRYNNYSSYYGYADYYGYSSYYGYSYGYPSYAYSAYCNYPSNYYSGYNNYYSDNGGYYNSNATNYYGNSNTNYISKSINDGGSEVVTPRRSSSSVSYYANKDNYDIKRRDNYRPGTSGNEGGRIVADETGGRFIANDNAVSPSGTRSKQSDVAVNRRQSVRPTSGTVQRSSNANNSRYQSSTINRPSNDTRSRSRGTVSSNTAAQRQTKNYVSRSSNQSSGSVSRSNNRQSTNNNRSTRSGVSSSSSRSNSSYNRSGNRSSYTPRSSSSRSKSSYSGSRSSSSSRSSAAPSRSSSSRSSAAPSRSSSRSSSSKSSSSKSSSGRNKN